MLCISNIRTSVARNADLTGIICSTLISSAAICFDKEDKGGGMPQSGVRV